MTAIYGVDFNVNANNIFWVIALQEPLSYRSRLKFKRSKLPEKSFEMDRHRPKSAQVDRIYALEESGSHDGR
jgi:hypothetical protein